MTDPRSTTKILVIGGGGHARVVIDVARASGFLPIAALDPGMMGTVCNGVEVLGGDDLARDMLNDGLNNAVIAIGDNRLRMKLAEQLLTFGFNLPCLIHPSAIISPSAKLQDGTVVMPLAVVNAAATIGRMVIINSGALVEHDCIIGDGAHVAPGCRLGGTVSVGKASLIGIGAVVRPDATIGDFSVIGAGSTVIYDIADNVIATGTPARARTSS